MSALAAVEAYRRIADVYDQAPNPLLALERRTLEPLLPDLRGLLVADVAAGTGRWTEYCQARGAHTIALDACHEMLARAPRPSAQADARNIPLRDNSADMVMCAFALGYAPAAFAELVRILRPGGTLIVSDVHPDALARGWSRSFRTGAEVIEVAHEGYTLDALHHATLRLSHLLEPTLGEPERALFARAGKLEAFEQATRHPAIFVAQWKKLC
ncbi:MAG: methyltransferase domain-containing protein [Acidobacteriota bacterium]